jgi:hypothetical protein
MYGREQKLMSRRDRLGIQRNLLAQRTDAAETGMHGKTRARTVRENRVPGARRDSSEHRQKWNEV